MEVTSHFAQRRKRDERTRRRRRRMDDPFLYPLCGGAGGARPRRLGGGGGPLFGIQISRSGEPVISGGRASERAGELAIPLNSEC